MIIALGMELQVFDACSLGVELQVFDDHNLCRHGVLGL